MKQAACHQSHAIAQYNLSFVRYGIGDMSRKSDHVIACVLVKHELPEANERTTSASDAASMCVAAALPSPRGDTRFNVSYVQKKTAASK